MAANRKRYWVIVGMVALLVLTGYLNYRLNLVEINSDESTEEVMAVIPPTDALEAEPLATPAMQILVGGQAPSDSAETLAMTSAGYFATYRADRDRTRVMELEMLESIIVNANTSSEQIADAQSQKLAVVNSMEKEMTIEGLIKAKGFSDAAVTIHRGSVNVILDKPVLSEAEVAQVLDICLRESGESAENIKIMPKE